MLVLKQSTSIDIRMGPFVDATDGVTPETGVTIAGADQAEVLKANGAATVAMTGTLAAVTGCDGWYDYTVQIGDVDTCGEVVFVIQDASVCLPVMVRAHVVEETIFDALFAASAAAFDANQRVDVGAVGGTTQTANDIGADVDAILVDTSTTLDTKLNDIQGATFSSATDSLEAIRDRGDSAWTGSTTTSDTGTAQAGAAGSITLRSGASATDNIYNGQVIYISSGTGAGQSRAIDGYNGTSKVATVITNWVTTPDATSVYDIYPDEIVEIAAAPTAAAVADAVWDESTTGHTGAGSFGEQLKNDVDAILTDTGELQADLTNGGRLDLLIDAILADTGELQTDWADGGRLDLLIDAILLDTGTTLDGKIDTVDTVVDAIKLVTDLLPDAGALTSIAQQATLTGQNDLSAAQVNAEVLDVLNTDTFSEPGQGAPGEAITLAAKIGYLYKAWRNRSTQTATQYSLYNDDAVTVDQKATVSDDTTTADKGEIVTGP